MRITTKGQVTIPKKVRDRLGLHAGSEVEFSLEERGALLCAKKPDEASRSPRVRDFMAHIRLHKHTMKLDGLNGDAFFRLLRD